MKRLPIGDDWKDHAVDCPNCKEPMLDLDEHHVQSTIWEPGYWKCDPAEEE